MPLSIVTIIVTFMTIILDTRTILEKPQPKEGGVIGPVLIFLQMEWNSLDLSFRGASHLFIQF